MKGQKRGRIAVLDDDRDLGDALARLLTHLGYEIRPYTNSAPFFQELKAFAPHCLLCDIRLGNEEGFDLAGRVRSLCPEISVVFMTAWPITRDAVDAVRRFNGLDYLDKPIDEDRLLAAIGEGIAWSQERGTATERIATLSRREREVFDLLVLGHANKAIADILGIAVKTVEAHRAAIIAKTGVSGLAQLIALSDRLR